MNISLDKIEEEYLSALCLRTGKNQQDVIKLAITSLYQSLGLQYQYFYHPYQPYQVQPYQIPTITIKPIEFYDWDWKTTTIEPGFIGVNNK